MQQSGMGQGILETISDWEGDADELARVAGQWCAMLRIDDDAEFSVRLIRDYAQRGILDRPRRDGKIAIYGWEHLVRLLAARVLLRDGWPLQKIADEFSILSLAEVRALLPGPQPQQRDHDMLSRHAQRKDPALEALRMIRSRATQPMDVMFKREPPRTEMRRNSPILDRAMLQQDLASSMRVLGEDPDSVQSRPFTRIEIARGVELNIETDRLRRLGRAEVVAIGQAVIASLLDPRHRKEEKPE